MKSAIILSLMLISPSTLFIPGLMLVPHFANAQITNQTAVNITLPGNETNIIPGLGAQNVSSVSILPIFIKVLKPYLSISLTDATALAMQELGSNSTALSASLRSEGEFLIYEVILIDESGKVNVVTLDPQTGDVLNARQLSLPIVSLDTPSRFLSSGMISSP
jgi:hypothetical protein